MKTIWAMLGVFCIAAGSGYGQTWTQISPDTNYYWAGVAMSADGTKLAATARQIPGDDSGAGIYFSTNSGAFWVQCQAPAGSWGPIACSADGSKLIAAYEGTNTTSYITNDGSIYISTN